MNIESMREQIAEDLDDVERLKQRLLKVGVELACAALLESTELRTLPARAVTARFRLDNAALLFASFEVVDEHGASEVIRCETTQLRNSLVYVGNALFQGLRGDARWHGTLVLDLNAKTFTTEV